MNRHKSYSFFQKMQQVLKEICHFRNWVAIFSASKFILKVWIKKVKTWKRQKNQFQIKGFLLWRSIFQEQRMLFIVQHSENLKTSERFEYQQPWQIARRSLPLSASNSIVRFRKKLFISGIGQWYPHTLTPEIELTLLSFASCYL